MGGRRALHLVGKGNKPAIMPLTVPVLRVQEVCRGERATGPLILRPMSGNPIDRRDAYWMVVPITKPPGSHVTSACTRSDTRPSPTSSMLVFRPATPRSSRVTPTQNHRALQPRRREPRPPRSPTSSPPTSPASDCSAWARQAHNESPSVNRGSGSRWQCIHGLS